MLDNFEEWSRVSVPGKGAKRMESKAIMGCGLLGKGGVRRVEGRSLPVGDMPTQWLLATGEGDGQGRNITYITRSRGNAELRAWLA